MELITSQTQLQEPVMESDQIWLVQFCERGIKNCEAFSAPYEEISGVLKELVRVASIDVTDPESEFTRTMKTKYKMKSPPTLYIFGSDKKQAPQPRQISSQLPSADNRSRSEGAPASPEGVLRDSGGAPIEKTITLETQQ
jgi:hypothetical protein